MKVFIKYFTDGLTPIEKVSKGDWIDLRSAEDRELKAGEWGFLRLGVGMILPEGYEAHIGPNDWYRCPALAMRDTVIRKNDRVCQFRLVEKQPEFEFEVVDHLKEQSRGGFGSTGKR